LRGNGGDGLLGVGGFVGGHQAEMALDDGQPGIFMHGADDWHVGVMLDDGPQLGLMAAAAEAVENHAGNADVRFEGLVTEDQRRDATCLAACVEHEYHGQIEQAGKGSVAIRPVER